MVLLHSVFYFFFLYHSPSLCLWTVFDSFSSNKDEVPSINPAANVFVFGNFTIHHKDWVTYSDGTDRPGEPFSFSISNGLTKMVNFPILIPDGDSQESCSFGFIYIFWRSICSTKAFLPLGNSDHVVVSVSTEFPSNLKEDALFHEIA